MQEPVNGNNQNNNAVNLNFGADGDFGNSVGANYNNTQFQYQNPQSNSLPGNSYGNPENVNYSAPANPSYQTNPSYIGESQAIQNYQPQLGSSYSTNSNYPVFTTSSSPVAEFDATQAKQSVPESSESVKKIESTKPNPLRFLARLIAILLFISIITAVGVVTLAITNPTDSRSKALLGETFLARFNRNSNVSSSSSSLSSIANTSQNSTNSGNLDFTPEKNAKSVADVVEASLPSVLSISLKSKGDNLNIGQDLSAGTGYIVTNDGFVLTNKHVVSVICKNDPNRIQITALTHDQKAYNLQLRSIDPIEDMAILKIDSTETNFPAVSFSDSDKLRVGQGVIAIGNVLGELQNTVTQGIVSGLNRSFETDLTDPCTNTNFQADNLIQTDAAINKGNSGGPMFDATGSLIGMNTLGSTNAQNIGLALPSKTILTVLEGFKQNNKIVRARLGVNTLQINSLRKAQNSWIPTEYGEIVFSPQGSPVDPNSAAFEAGLREGDIVLEVDGKKMISESNNPAPLRREILSRQPESKMKVLVLKTKSKTEQGFTYETNPIELEITLGGVSFDLAKKQIVVS